MPVRPLLACRAVPRAAVLARTLTSSSLPSSSVPEAFASRLRDWAGDDDARAVLDAMHTPRSAFCVRVNDLADCDAVRSAVERLASIAGARRVEWAPEAWLVPLAERAAVLRDAMVLRGVLYPQDLPSVAAARVLGAAPGQRVLDLCAAPGSKTTHIAALLRKQGRVLANELSRSRAHKLRAVLKLMGADGLVEVRVGDGCKLPAHLAGEFDAALVDAPCSGEGRFHASDPSTWQEWSPAASRRISSVQKQLLHAAIQATRPGGAVLYSTCTLSPVENECVVARALEVHAGRVSLEAMPPELGALPPLPTRPGVSDHAGKRVLAPELAARCVRVLPSRWGGGFFLARLRVLPRTAAVATTAVRDQRPASPRA